MADTKIESPATDMIADIWPTIQQLWRFHPTDAGTRVRHMVMQMQRALVRKAALPAGTPETGILDRQTLLAAQKFVYGDSKQFTLIPKVYDYLRKLASDP